MNLTIDCGNTFIKTGVFRSQGVLLHKDHFDIDVAQGALIRTFKMFPEITDTIVSSVVVFPKALQIFLEQKSRLWEVSPNLKWPFKTVYKTKNTWGSDRVCLVSAAACKHPKTNVLVVSAGTCITYDFVDDRGHHLGGSISPGIDMRLKALHSFTEKLPEISLEEDVSFIGCSTKESILSGVIFGVVAEIDGFVMNYRDIYKDNILVVFTGGSVNFLLKRLKSSIFAAPNFLSEGLNALLEYNK